MLLFRVGDRCKSHSASIGNDAISGSGFNDSLATSVALNLKLDYPCLSPAVAVFILAPLVLFNNGIPYPSVIRLLGLSPAIDSLDWSVNELLQSSLPF